MGSKRWIAGLLVCLMAVLAGCSSSSNNSPTTPTTPEVTVGVTPSVVAVGAGQTQAFSAQVTGDDQNMGVAWSVNGVAGGSSTSGTIDASGNYTAPASAPTANVTITATSKRNTSDSSSATVVVIATGTVAATAHPQVAQYTINIPDGASVSVQFGLDASYGRTLSTWSQSAPTGGGAVTILVAGMYANTKYHMRAVVQLSSGLIYYDPDQTFTTGAVPATQLPLFAAVTTKGMTPQGGLEMVDLVGAGAGIAPVVVTDLNGVVVWSYYSTAGSALAANPVKLLPNGHFLINYSGTVPDGLNSVMQEVDLTGTVVWQMTAADLNAALAAATCAGCNITVIGTHHDFVMLPSGHLVVLAATQQVISGATVAGDVLIDLDENRKPVWLWNEFDHLDTSRHPMGGNDWTHSNAVVYSADDGNLIVSIRHQNWLVKVDYNNGAGAGDVIWKLGYQGDFTLVGGTDPTDWFYAQHGPSFASSNTTGKYSMVLFDNGNDRYFPTGQATCTTVASATCYSTVPVLQIDETVTPKTATLVSNPTAPYFSFFGGNAEVLANGNVEFCESAGPHGGVMFEMTPASTPQQVWRMDSAFNSAGTYPQAYRGQRISSMYPGVQW